MPLKSKVKNKSIRKRPFVKKRNKNSRKSKLNGGHPDLPEGGTCTQKNINNPVMVWSPNKNNYQIGILKSIDRERLCRVLICNDDDNEECTNGEIRIILYNNVIC